MKKKSNKKKKKSNIIYIILLIIAASIFVYSVYRLVDMMLPYYTGGKEYDKIKKYVEVEQDTEDTVDNEEKPQDTRKLKINFEELLKENPDTVGWLYFEEPSVISYPIVKSSDNNEYLTKTFSANDNKLGAIFMDMNANAEFKDRNTFIYGHNLQVGGEMFSQLNEYASEEFCKQHPYFYIYTLDGAEHKYQVFSAGVVKDVADNYRIKYENDEDYMAYLQMCKNSSNYQVDVPLTEKSKIVSLSTCTNVIEDERFLLQGVLVEEK